MGYIGIGLRGTENKRLRKAESFVSEYSVYINVGFHYD
jgi:hypothetical protein